MKNKDEENQNDALYLAKAFAGVKPLKNNKIRLKPPHPFKKPSLKPANHHEETVFNESDIAQVGSEDYLSYKHPSISNKILRKLRKGQYNVEALLDLHELTAEDARKTVVHFLSESRNLAFRVVLIIHGKGKHSQAPVLKMKLNHWLRQIPIVLAFCSATAEHGNRGALYVLLKRKLEEPIFD